MRHVDRAFQRTTLVALSLCLLLPAAGAQSPEGGTTALEGVLLGVIAGLIALFGAVGGEFIYFQF